MGTERNLHQFSATVGAESYGLTYADYSSPSTDWESAVNAERDLIVNGLYLHRRELGSKCLF